MQNEFTIHDNRSDKRVEASIIIATYNQEWCLEPVLEALMNQSDMRFEIMIADDGSLDQTHEIAKKFPIFLIYQPHKGFRKTRVINEASKHVKSPYMIFLDGDCVPHRDFVKEHIRNREKGTYLAGRRIDLSEELTAKYLKNRPFPRIERFLLKHFFKLEKANRLFVCRNPFLRKLFKQDFIHDMMGCNASFWVEDYRKVDGYDERYVKAHREDGDLCARFQHLGLKIRSVKGLALIFHFWHKREQYYLNEEIFNETVSSDRVKAVKGLSAR